jgi:DNA-binding LacI/PurR family transcriptional regulator
MRVTIKDIAKIAEVSHTTVSRALRNHPGIPPETISRIQKIADELGYVPSAAARSLKTNRSCVVGVIVNRIADPFFAEVLDGVQDILQNQAYSIFLASSGSQGEHEQSIIQAMIERRVEGLIVCASHISHEDYETLKSAKIPIVLVHNRIFEDINYSLHHDDFYGGKVMTQHLLELGHQRIAFIADPKAGRVSNQRLAGFQAALEAVNLPHVEAWTFYAKSADLEGGFEAARHILDQPTLPTALFCFNDMIAVGAMQAFQEAGLSIPQDLSIVGFDNVALSRLVKPSLTTFDQPKYRLGSEAAHMLLRLLDVDGTPQEREIITLRGEIVLRQSTAQPKH